VGEERLAGRERAHALISMAGSSISESPVEEMKSVSDTN